MPEDQSIWHGLAPHDVIVVSHEDCQHRARGAKETPSHVGAPSRRHSSVTARRCAQEALVRLTGGPARVSRGAGGEPVWPTGVVGSITHAGSHAAVAVAPSQAVIALGIDLERHLPLSRRFLRTLSPREQACLADLTAAFPDVRWSTLWFSAKESVYKAWYPRTGYYLGFADVRVALSTDGTLTAAVTDSRRAGAGAPRRFTGRYAVSDDLVATLLLARPTLARSRRNRQLTSTRPKEEP